MLTIIPAYGRDYTNKKQVLDDLNAKKDFLAAYYNSRWQAWNIEQAGEGEQISVRYSNSRKQTIVTIKKGVAR